MTTNVEDRLEKMTLAEAKRLESFFQIPGKLILDTCWITGFPMHRLGSSNPHTERIGYSFMKELMGRYGLEAEVTVPSEVRKELRGRVEKGYKRILGAMSPTRSESEKGLDLIDELEEVVFLVNEMREYAELFPTESHIPRNQVEMSELVSRAIKDLGDREKLVKDFSNPDRNQIRRANRYNDALIFAKGVVLKLVHPDSQVTVLTRDARLPEYLERLLMPRNLNFLRTKYDLDLSEKRMQGLKVICDEPISEEQCVKFAALRMERYLAIFEDSYEASDGN